MNDTNELMSRYFNTKDIAKRYAILKQLVFHLPEDGKEYFLKAFKKERYLDMRLTAVRGYAAYASEAEVDVLMKKLLELLKKRAETTPYNYQEYELLRCAYLTPYLVKKYSYCCFKQFQAQLELQYQAMPEAFKGIFTCDAQGEYVALLSPEETKQRMDDFWAAKQ